MHRGTWEAGRTIGAGRFSFTPSHHFYEIYDAIRWLAGNFLPPAQDFPTSLSFSVICRWFFPSVLSSLRQQLPIGQRDVGSHVDSKTVAHVNESMCFKSSGEGGAASQQQAIKLLANATAPIASDW